ncbi:MAG: toxin VasX [Pseudomonadota bacterium]
MSDAYGDFSASRDPEDPAFHCTPTRIPIQPVRFSLLPYDLSSVSKPGSIGAPGDYIIRLLRRGFVYIYVEAVEDEDGATSRNGTWYVFRRGTSPNDVNADEVPEGTQYLEQGSFLFHKYEWTDNYGRGDWRFDGESGRHCWVPSWASKIWIAYSEYRWPSNFFRDGHGAAFRQRMMTPVDLRGSNQWAAYIGEATDLVEEWKPAESRGPTLRSRLALSQTAFQETPPNTWDPALVPGANDRCVGVVAVPDPLGDIAEMNYRLEQKDAHQRAFSASHAFPLSIGHISEQLEGGMEPRDNWYNEGGILPDLISANGPALKPGWKPSYLGLRSIVETAEAITAELVAAVLGQIADTGNGMLGTHLELAAALAQGDDLEAQEYFSVLLGRALGSIGITPLGSQAISQGLGANLPVSGPSLRSVLSTFRRLWGATVNKGFDAYQRRQYSFRIVMEAVAVELGAQLGSGQAAIGTWQDALDAGFRQGPNARLMFSTQTVDLDDAINYMTNGQTGLQGAGYVATDIAAEIDDAGRAISQQMVGAGATADIPTIRTSTTVEMVGGFDAAGRIEVAGLTYASAGLLLSTWGLIATATAQSRADGMFERGAITSIGQSKPFQVTMAAVGLAEGLRSTFQAAGRVGATQSARITAEVVETIYQGAGAANLRGLTLVSARTGAASAGLGQSLNKLLPKVAIAVGLTMSAIEFARGVERQDRSQMLGNALMFVGGLMLIPGLNIAVGVAGAIVLTVGLLVSMTSYSQIEDVARLGFWGSSDGYHDLPTRPGFMTLISASKDLPAPWDDWYANELSSFAELGWSPVIEDPVAGDGRLLIRTQAVSQGNTGLVDVDAWSVGHRGRRQRLSVGKLAVPGQPQMVVTLSGNTSGQVVVRASVRGTRTGIDFETERRFSNP